jgi:hypothetical protein
MGEEGEDTSWKSFMERIRRGSGRSSRHNPSSLIQFKSEAKSMVHFLNKGGGYIGEDTLGRSSTERKGVRSGRTPGSPVTMRVGDR